MDLAGQELCKAIACRIRPAGAIANVAHRRDVLSEGRTGWVVFQNGLAAFARERPGAALGDKIHGAGMEIHAKGGDGALSRGAHNSGATRRSNAAVGGAVRVNPEGLVFFNDPAVISKRRQAADAGAKPVAVVIRLSIHHVDREIAGGWESDGCRSGRGSSLRVLHCVTEGKYGRRCGTWRWIYHGEPALRIPDQARGDSTRGDKGERQVARVRVAQ